MIGEVFQSNRDGAVTVLKYEGAKKVTVQWHNTGNIAVVQAGNLRKGWVRDSVAIEARKREEVARGKAHTEKLAAAVIRREQERAKATERKAKAEQERELKRIAEESKKAERESAQSANKAIRDAKALATCDLSLIDVDENKPRKGVLELDFKDRNGKWVLRFRDPVTTQFVQTRLGKLHNNMSQRAKAGGSVQDVYNKGYKGVGMSEMFADPQAFCDWVVQQPGWGLGWQLDKDLLGSAERQYSEDNCVFLPRRLNLAIAISKDEDGVRRLVTAYVDVLAPRAYAALLAWEPK